MEKIDPIKMIRCAVYTRKSTEEGLDQEFNSLDAQREACEAYITSQKREGWSLVSNRYDDGGFSGGTLERPALKRLLTDIQDGLIDCVVVYKIDRLSRALIDFTRLVEIFDQQGTTFVSITQSFNTTNSMGRLTLNILLSFAQFERETITERIRDKVAASRKKGMWMGGFPPLGYDIQNRKLIVNPKEADLIRHVLQRFTEIGSGTLLCQELNEDGYRTKSWTSISTNRFHAGRPFDKGTIYRLLNNRVYLGEAVHKGNAYPGEHDAIIDQELWDKVQKILAKNSHQRGNYTRSKTPSPLRGVIRCWHCNRAMTTSHTRKKGVLYRYYVCMYAAKNSYGDCPIGSVSAGDVESIAFKQIQDLILSPEMVVRTWKKANGVDEHVSEREVVDALHSLNPVWNELFPTEQNRLVQLLIKTVNVNTDGIEIHLRVDGLNNLVKELT